MELSGLELKIALALWGEEGLTLPEIVRSINRGRGWYRKVNFWLVYGSMRRLVKQGVAEALPQQEPGVRFLGCLELVVDVIRYRLTPPAAIQ